MPLVHREVFALIHVLEIMVLAPLGDLMFLLFLNLLKRILDVTLLVEDFLSTLLDLLSFELKGLHRLFVALLVSLVDLILETTLLLLIPSHLVSNFLLMLDKLAIAIVLLFLHSQVVVSDHIRDLVRVGSRRFYFVFLENNRPLPSILQL